MLTIREVCCPCAHPTIIFLWVEHITVQGCNDITVSCSSTQTAHKKGVSSCGLAQRVQTPGDFKQQQAAIHHVSEGIMGRVSQWSVGWSKCWTPRRLQSVCVEKRGIFLSRSRLSECVVVKQQYEGTGHNHSSILIWFRGLKTGAAKRWTLDSVNINHSFKEPSLTSKLCQLQLWEDFSMHALRLCLQSAVGLQGVGRSAVSQFP